MIFVLAQNEPTLILMLAESDVGELRRGATKFVDCHQLRGRSFDRVVVSLSKTDAESVAMIKATGHDMGGGIVVPKPEGNEVQCPGCEAILAAGSLFEDRCIVCWAIKAKALQTGSN